MPSLSAGLLALALSASPDAGAPPFSWDVPGVITLVPAGDHLSRNGLPLAVFAARSKWKLNELLAHYAKRFSQAGFYLPRGVALPGLRFSRVVALDDVHMISFLVYGWQEPDGTTTLMLGASNLGKRQPVAQNGLPVFPAATHLTSFNLEQAVALSFTVKATDAEVLDFYRSVLPSGGYVEREPGVFVRGERAVKVLVKKDGEALSVVVLEGADDGLAINGTEGGSRTP